MRLKDMFKATSTESKECPLDATDLQPTARVKKASKWDSLSLDTWFWETLSMDFSVVCFIAIFGVLLGYNQKAMPSFPKGLTLNTIVSILATGAKSSLLCVVGTPIGQLKWTWFQGEKKRPLYDLQSFDDANRGPWGSVMVLLRFSHKKGSFVLMLGAVIIVLSLAFDPFIQQVLQFPVRQVAEGSVTAEVEQAILPFDIRSPGGFPGSYVGAIQAGLFSKNFNLNPTCSSGNCTWNSFQSAGWCSRCENATSEATLVGCDIDSFNTSSHETQEIPCSITLLDGTWVNKVIKGSWLDTAYDSGFVMNHSTQQILQVNNQREPYLNQSILGVWSPLMDISYIEILPSFAAHNRPLTPAKLKERLKVKHAIECILSPCVKTYVISVSNGIPSIQTSSPDFGEIFHPVNENAIPHKESYTERSRVCWKSDRDALVNVSLNEDNWPPELICGKALSSLAVQFPWISHNG